MCANEESGRADDHSWIFQSEEPRFLHAILPIASHTSSRIEKNQSVSKCCWHIAAEILADLVMYLDMTQRLITCYVSLMTTVFVTLPVKNQLTISHRDEEKKHKPRPSRNIIPSYWPPQLLTKSTWMKTVIKCKCETYHHKYTQTKEC